MYRPRHCGAPDGRRGVILLVVITMLTLFAVVGLTFVFYAESEATASRIYKEANDAVPDYYQYLSEQTQPFNLALEQLIYDVEDDKGIDSALRGHSLARTLYGWNDDFKASHSGNPNTVPFNGVGRIHTDGSSKPFMNNLNQDDFNLVNYTYHRADGFLRDPERTYLADGRAYRTDPSQKRGLFTGGFNPPYTYPDHNSLFLAAVTADGTVLVPSFHRPWLGAGPLDPANTTWQPTPPPGADWIKYTTLRPLASQHRGFPALTTPGGDLQNIPNASGINDSIWIDLGAPVATLPAPDGRRYRPLFAFLVRDLDNALNVNAHGNLALQGQEHAAHQGWGKWEVNPKWVLNADPTEWKQLFLHPTFGRYGGDSLPGAGGAWPASRTLPGPSGTASYAAYDFDAARGTSPNRTPTPRIAARMPAGNNAPFTGFPKLAPGYDSAAGSELQNHPAAYNLGKVGAAGDRLWKVDDLKGLLAYGPKDNNNPAGSREYERTDLFQALPNNLNTARIRNLLTTLSADLDRAGASPYVWDPAATPLRLNPYNVDDPRTWVPSNTSPFPSIATRPSTPVPNHSEFRAAGQAATAAGVDWRSALPEAGRLNLNVNFAAFLAPRADGVIDLSVPATAAQYQAALRMRQKLAGAIFTRLQAATGALQPSAGAGTPEYNANRWLAQLAVNIVDYIDNDDSMTPFTGWGNAGDFVFGTEMPRLVVNEVYAQLDNDRADAGLTDKVAEEDRKATVYKLNLWVELHNPLNAEPNLSEGGKAVLYRTANCVPYRLAITNPNPKLRDPSNVTGAPDDNPPTTLATLPDLGTTALQVEVLPANGAFSGTVGENKGFFVAAPPDGGYLDRYDPAVTETDPNSPFKRPTVRKPELRIRISPDTTDNLPPANPTVLLRRLANPHLPENTEASSPAYNPYVTVDYVENVPWRDRLKYDAAGAHDPADPPEGWADRATQAAVGRAQPYAAHTSWRRNQAPEGVADHAIKHTFFRHNAIENTPPAATPFSSGGTLDTPFDWLVHLDRPIQNPIELLHVSGFKPHELTQQFKLVSGGNIPWFPPRVFGHEVRWADDKSGSPLFRFLELVQTHDFSAGATPGGRVQGKVNINTIWDKEIFMALAGVDPANAQEVAAAEDVWRRFIATRTPGLLTAPPQFGNRHQPFTSFATGGETAGVNQTLLRADARGPVFVPSSSPPLTDPVAHPYLGYEIPRRIMASTTVRSNVFAVWCTVGYFEVKDETTQPYTLGAELGSDRNRVFRSKFFAIVDRTQLSIDPNNPTRQGKAPLVVVANGSVQAGATVTIPAAPSGSTADGTWNLQPGNNVLVGVGTPSQTLTQVTAIGAGTFTVSTLSGDLEGPFGVLVPHAGDTSPTVPGNPGPQPMFQYNQAPWSGTVVRSFTRLE